MKHLEPDQIPSLSLEELIERAAEIKTQLKKVEPIKDELDLVKFQIDKIMNESGSMRTKAVRGYYAVKVEKSDVRIVNQDEVKLWLTANDLKIEDFTSLNTSKVTPLVKTALKTTGEIVPGTELFKSSYLSLREA